MVNEYFMALNGNKGIAFMDGAIKGDIKSHLDEVLHIAEFGFIQGEDAPFGVVRFSEIIGEFFFMNAITTAMLKQVEKDGMVDALVEQGIVFTKHVSKKNREYIGFKFVD